MIKKVKSIIWLQLVVVVLRYQIGAAFVFANLIKIKGNRFTGDSGLDRPIDSARHFFETLYASGIYWKFIGFAQLIVGGLLMTKRFSRLGAIFFFPIILNVFVITISYDFNYTPVITGLMLLASVGLLL
ncbi:MAG: putative membrane protein YphA (DoxX/SURF4 family) [Cyclobacteriaceae bacterium]|jgi:uncharacterized membrane protein YphA (DoxX/SURF4 family)